MSELWDDLDDDDPIGPKTCKFCGAANLAWIHTGVRWRLFGEDKKPHVCPPDPDDFEVLEK